VGFAKANAPETASVQLNQASQPCQSTVASNQTLDRFATAPDPIPVYGSRQFATIVTLPGAVGDYHLCLYAARDGQRATPT
jgi:hypothetical protein